MKIKRVFNKIYHKGMTAEEAQELGIEPTPELDHVVGHFPPRQKFWDRLIAIGVDEGWLSVSKGKFIIKSEPNDIVYKVITKPGYYCCFDNCPMESAEAAQAHIAANFANQECPDPSNPAGYRKDNFYLCELIEG